MLPRLCKLAILPALCAAACVGSSEPSGPWHSWSTLRFDARTVPLLSGKIEMQRGEVDGKRVLETTTTASFLGTTIASPRQDR